LLHYYELKKSTGQNIGLQNELNCLPQWFWGGIYQRRTKNGIGRLKKTVPAGTAKTQRMETTGVASAIVKEVRFFFIFLDLGLEEIS